MSSRALRKAQREREKQERAQKLQEAEGNVDELPDETAPTTLQPSLFAVLGEAGDADSGDGAGDDDEGLTTGDEANEDGDVVRTDTVAHASINATSATSKRKKKRKKSRKSTTITIKGTCQEAEDLDEIDRALRQLSTNEDATHPAGAAANTNGNENETNVLLAVDPSHLHAQNEMRRLFGRAALGSEDDNQAQDDPNAAGNRRQQRRAQQAGLAQILRGQPGGGGRSAGLAAIALRRNSFIQGKEDWPVASGGGLGMEVEEKRVDGTVLYRFVHNRAYQDVQAQFHIGVESMDPNRLVVLLRHNPYHISTLLQVSEIAKQDRDHTTAGDLLERALFNFGRAVHSTFPSSLSEGKARLDFARPENREFWLASWRYMQNLSMRATWRTVYEWAKLLLSLSPDEDPYAIWLVLDQYALRARQDLDYITISRNLIFEQVHRSMPNVQVSQALAEYRAGNRGKGKQALFTAVRRFPWLISRLLQELNLDPPPSVWGKEPRTEREKLHAELYATQAKDLWNTPENSALLMEVASALPPETSSAPPDESDISRNEARHILLSDTPTLIALLPRKLTSALVSAGDPLPPDRNLPSYTLSTSSGVRSIHRTAGTPADNLRELQGLYGFFSSLFPWFNPSNRVTGTDDDVEHVQPSEAEIERRIQESGVSEELIVERTQRMMELQQRLMGEVEGEGEGEEETPSENAG